MKPKHPNSKGSRGLRAVLPFAAVVTAAVTLAGCSAAGTEPIGRADTAIAGGTADGTHENVFLLISHQQDRGGLCTATLIAPNLLLTARHCVSPGGGDHVLCGEAVLGEPYPASAFVATNAAVPTDGSAFFRVTKVQVPVQGEDTCGYDIALIVLAEVVPPHIAEPAIPRIDLEVVPGEAYTAVGYGEDETGASTGSRMRREGLSVACEPGSCGSGVESTEFRGEAGICSGDSGGPALDATGKVVGVVSRGSEDCGTPVYGTVTAWRGFLVEAAKEAAIAGGYAPPFWVATGKSDPPPGAPGGGNAGAGGSSGSGEPGAEGEACSVSASCRQGLLCYAETAALEEAACVRQCGSTSECSAGQVCEDLGPASGCVSPRGGGADESGCGVATSAPPGGFRSSGLAGLALCIAWLSSRRRRRSVG